MILVDLFQIETILVHNEKRIYRFKRLDGHSVRIWLLQQVHSFGQDFRDVVILALLGPFVTFLDLF